MGIKHFAVAAIIAMLAQSAPIKAAPAQATPDITGQWQGVLHADKDRRVLLKIDKSGAGFKAVFYSVDDGPDPMTEGTATFDGETIKIPSNWSSYTAKLNAKGDVMTGSMYQGVSLPLKLVRADVKSAWQIPKIQPDTSPHKSQMVAVEKDVRLEVLDWGGSGKPLILLPGLGADAHVFDKFAPRFTAKYHVYGISRRGFGKSDKPDATVTNYAANRLGDDVLKVMDTLKLARPVLAGWSIGGSELSSIGTRHPEKVAGLVYLDAAYVYAFYMPGIPQGDANLNIDINDLRAQINKLNISNSTPRDAVRQIDEMLKTNLPQLQADLRAARSYYEAFPPPPADAPPAQDKPMAPEDAVFAGIAKYGSPKAPVLAVYAYPKKIEPNEPAALKTMDAQWNQKTADIIKRFTAGNPKAKIVTIGDSRHDVFDSNPAEVEREMKTFMDGLR